jgi:hypothetical protein
MIVKVQRPLGGHGAKELPWLVYSEGRKHMQRVTPPRRLIRNFGADAKRYYEADLIRGRFVLVRQVEEQPW